MDLDCFAPEVHPLLACYLKHFWVHLLPSAVLMRPLYAECEPPKPALLASQLQEPEGPGQGEEEAADGKLLTEEKLDEEEEDGDRHNFASAKDGAKIVAANKDAKKPSAVLDSDSDTYLRNECKADKWLAIELSQVIWHSQPSMRAFPLCKIIPLKVNYVTGGLSGLRPRNTAIARIPVISLRRQKHAFSCRYLSGGLLLGITSLSRLSYDCLLI